ncbi:MAG TPA: cytochrome c [Candidatus Angelobacter sp.]|nr:cytochrome c [Candidatus Angelobacter sp.]
MKIRLRISGALLASAMVLSLAAFANSGGKDAAKEASAVKETSKDAPASTAAASAVPAAQDETFRLEGEKRFRSNCARCHAAPPKFPPRMMATIVRHMRVRAMITDQDMRLILRYMTE